MNSPAEKIRKSYREALIDAMTFWCAGFTNVTTSYGVEWFYGDHVTAFQRYGTKGVLIAA